MRALRFSLSGRPAWRFDELSPFCLCLCVCVCLLGQVKLCLTSFTLWASSLAFWRAVSFLILSVFCFCWATSCFVHSIFTSLFSISFFYFQLYFWILLLLFSFSTLYLYLDIVIIFIRILLLLLFSFSTLYLYLDIVIIFIFNFISVSCYCYFHSVGHQLIRPLNLFCYYFVVKFISVFCYCYFHSEGPLTALSPQSFPPFFVTDYYFHFQL